jgi:hypothetical protein
LRVVEISLLSIQRIYLSYIYIFLYLWQLSHKTISYLDLLKVAGEVVRVEEAVAVHVDGAAVACGDVAKSSILELEDFWRERDVHGAECGTVAVVARARGCEKERVWVKRMWAEGKEGRFKGEEGP